MDEAGGKGVRLIRYDEFSFWNKSIPSVVLFVFFCCKRDLSLQTFSHPILKTLRVEWQNSMTRFG